jgi:hypothetical protein
MRRNVALESFLHRGRWHTEYRVIHYSDSTEKAVGEIFSNPICNARGLNFSPRPSTINHHNNRAEAELTRVSSRRLEHPSTISTQANKQAHKMCIFSFLGVKSGDGPGGGRPILLSLVVTASPALTFLPKTIIEKPFFPSQV